MTDPVLLAIQGYAPYPGPATVDLPPLPMQEHDPNTYLVAYSARQMVAYASAAVERVIAEKDHIRSAVQGAAAANGLLRERAERAEAERDVFDNGMKLNHAGMLKAEAERDALQRDLTELMRSRCEQDDQLVAERDEHDRWLAEMCADYRLSADDHAVSRRLAINGLIHSLRAELDALKGLLREARPMLIEWIDSTEDIADDVIDLIRRIDAALNREWPRKGAPARAQASATAAGVRGARAVPRTTQAGAMRGVQAQERLFAILFAAAAALEENAYSVQSIIGATQKR